MSNSNSSIFFYKDLKEGVHVQHGAGGNGSVRELKENIHVVKQLADPSRTLKSSTTVHTIRV